MVTRKPTTKKPKQPSAQLKAKVMQYNKVLTKLNSLKTEIVNLAKKEGVIIR